MPRYIFPLAFILISLLLVACASTAQETNPERLIPSNANMIVKVQVARMLEDVDFESLYASTPKDSSEPQTFEEFLDMVETESGINLREFSNAVAFGDVNTTEDYIGIIARGRFDAQRLNAAIEEESSTELTVTQYNGHEIRADQSGETPFGFSVLGEDTLVLGSLAAVQAVIDVQESDQEAVSGPVYEAFEDLGDPLFRLIIEVPEVPENLPQPHLSDPIMGELPDLGSMNSLDMNGLEGMLGNLDGMAGMFEGMEALQKIDMAGVTLDKDGEALGFQAQLDFNTSEAAAQASDLIQGFMLMAQGMSQDAETRSSMEKLTVTQEEARLMLSFRATMEELEELGSMRGGEGMPMIPDVFPQSGF